MRKEKVYIKCPECDHVQPAIVDHFSYGVVCIHSCKKCRYLIMESEWKEVEKPGAKPTFKMLGFYVYINKIGLRVKKINGKYKEC